MILEQIAEALALSVSDEIANIEIQNISTDTRTLQAGSLLIPLIGDWWTLPTQLASHQDAHAWQCIVFPCMGIGALLSGLRDWGAQAGWKGRLFLWGSERARRDH